MVLPSNIIDRVITWYHEILCHPDIDRSYKHISQHIYFRGLEARICTIIQRCSCQKDKHMTRKYGHLPASLQEYEPWECVQTDLFGPWKFKDVNGIDRVIQAVSFIDVATRWPELHVYNSKISEDIFVIFDREWLNRYPSPRMVIYDNGSEFTAKWEEMLESFGIKTSQPR